MTEENESIIRLKILLIEDEDFIAQRIKKFIERYNHKVIIAGDTKKGLEIISKEKDNIIDIVFLDYYLEDNITCIGLAEKIKQKSPATILVSLSGHENMKILSNIINAGYFDHILTKNSDIQEIIDFLDIALETKKERLKVS